MEGTEPGKTVGLRLRCFYSVYMSLLHEARLAYENRGGPADSPLAARGRVGLVSVHVNNMLSVEVEGPATCLESAALDRGIVLKVSRLRVNDVMDQLPLVPSESFLETVQNAPIEWHRRWHPLVDAMQPVSWRDFPAKMVATIPRY